MERVERLGKEAWFGVAAVDRGESNEPSPLARAALLVGGDVGALVLFACIGRLTHGEPLDAAAVLATAGPFLAGWLPAAALLGGYGARASRAGAGAAAATAAKAWAVGIPVGLVVRSLVRGYMPDKSFLLVSLAVTGVLLIGWRTALAAAAPQEAPQSPIDQLKARKNKSGGPFEFLQLLFGLVGRW